MLTTAYGSSSRPHVQPIAVAEPVRRNTSSGIASVRKPSPR